MSNRLVNSTWYFIFGLILFITILRFVGLEKAPPGFHNDEAWGATHAMCIGQTGSDAGGVRLPLFPGSAAGGVYTPVHTYTAVLWTWIFGTSIAAFRSLSAFIVTLTLLGLFFLAQLFLNKNKSFKFDRRTLYIVLAASLSPWAWQFSRMACDDPTLMPMGLVWGTYFFLRSKKLSDGFISALMFCISVYEYPPARAQLPFLVLALIIFKMRQRLWSWAQLVILTLTGIIFCIPILYGIYTGKLLSRFMLVGLRSNTVLGYLTGLMRNFSLHLSPRFLFFSGDGNLRHSTQHVGEMSWLDIFALLVGVFLLGLWVFSEIKRKKNKFSLLDLGILFSFYGFFTGILSPSMTVEGIPHALRGVGAWPFLALFTGLVLIKFDSMYRYTAVAATIISLTFSLWFFPDYFLKYPVMSSLWFDGDVIPQAIATGPSGNWVNFENNQSPLYHDRQALGYFIMQYGHKTCDEMREIITQGRYK